AAAEALSAFTLAPVVPQPESLFSKDWREAANRIMAQTLSEKGLTLVTAKRVDKVDLLRRLDQSGILKMRGAIDHVVKSVGMSRAGIYNLLRDARKTQENSTSEAA
ncbi:MAG: helix-turn-helix domain-containing protein, partial [Rhodospirillales bacterium]|nr:helix-turn-helix domain-containing protein [Rhodospirillales bacterium]